MSIRRHGFYAASEHDGDGRLTYCGRFALQAGFGINPIKASTLICRRRNMAPGSHVRSTSVGDLATVLKASGAKPKSISTLVGREPTLTQWLRDKPRGKDEVYIVLITNHWIVIRGDWLIDTHHPDGHDLTRGKKPFARKRVRYWIEVET